MRAPESRASRRQLLAKMGVATVGASGATLQPAPWGHDRRGRRPGPRGRGAAVATARLGPPIAPGVPLPAVTAYVVSRGGAAALVDAGLPGTIGDIGAVLDATGRAWADVQHVILTHYHLDHTGAAADILDRAPRATLWVGPADIPALEEPAAGVPEGPRLRRAARPAQDGAEIFGLRVVATPGHTAGHICLLDAELGALFTGDTVLNSPVDVSGFFPGVPLINPGGGLIASNAVPSTEDAAQNNASIRRLATLDFERAFISHGYPIETGAAAAFRALAARLA